MKKIYLILPAVLAFIPLNASTGNFNGRIDVSDVTINEHGNDLHIDMLVDIKEDAVTKCQSIAVIPTLSEGNSEASFPYVLVNGRNKSRIFNRHSKFRYTELTENPPFKVIDVKRKYTGGQVRYSASIGREPWMENPELNIRFVLISCANERQVYNMAISGVSTRKDVAQVVVVELVVPAPTAVPVEVEAVKKEVRLSRNAYLDFKTGSSEILPSYKNNPHELVMVNKTIDSIGNNPKVKITAINVTGYASPEGSYSANGALAVSRAREFTRYLRNRYPDMSGLRIETSSVAEDWDELRTMVLESNIAGKDGVLKVIDSTDAPDVKESKLRGLNGGATWKIMLDAMFPRLRRVEYHIDYTVEK